MLNKLKKLFNMEKEEVEFKIGEDPVDDFTDKKKERGRKLNSQGSQRTQKNERNTLKVE